MTTSETMKYKAKKIAAFKELVQIAKEGIFDDGRYPGGMFARCLDPIRSAENSPEDRPRNLNAVLYNLTERKIPNTVERPYM
ncbi:MAG: hypothetical protein J6Y85_01875, partial [Alphaproteobacteria bacterium]|nr:hypothetical protein [Alphaproteobacteria bacterium]